jgi:hypothetical protein
MVMSRSGFGCAAVVPLAVLLLIAAGVVAAMWAMPGKFIANSATAWVWVEPSRQPLFTNELRNYARQKSLRFSCNEVPAPPKWKVIGMTILTPRENEITIINASASDKFAVGITIEHPEPGWQHYWQDFRAYVQTRHKWRDDLKPGH